MGKFVRNPIRRGDIIKTFDLVQANDNLASLIPPGYRATTISLSLPSEILQFLKFGNRVDVVFSDTTKTPIVTKTIMKNIMVMKAATDTEQKQAGANQVFAHVTLAVLPEASEILSNVAKKGKIDLSICPISESHKKDEYMSIEEALGINKAVPSRSEPVKTIQVEVIRGTQKEKVAI